MKGENKKRRTPTPTSVRCNERCPSFSLVETKKDERFWCVFFYNSFRVLSLISGLPGGWGARQISGATFKAGGGEGGCVIQ